VTIRLGQRGEHRVALLTRAPHVFRAVVRLAIGEGSDQTLAAELRPPLSVRVLRRRDHRDQQAGVGGKGVRLVE